MSNKNPMITTLLVLCFLAIVFFGYSLVTAFDQLRYHTENLEKRLAEISEKLDSVNITGIGMTGLSIAGSGAAQHTESTGDVKPGNAEFFDANADAGGRYIKAISSDTGNMNMLLNNDATVSDFWGITYDSLAERNLKNLDEFVPKMAESWSVSEDQLVYHIKLRKGILWHDFTDPVTKKEWKNVEVTATDFKFFVDVVKNEKVDAVPLRSYLADIDRIEVKNDYEFDVIWTKPYMLSREITLGLQPLPKHFYYDYEGEFDGAKFNDDNERNRMIVGCGPYQFEKWEKGKRVIFRRFEKYYGRTQGFMPSIKYMVFDLIQHPNTRLQALKSKDIDADSLTAEQWMTRTDTPEFDEKTGFLKKLKLPSFSYSHIGLNQTNPVFQDKRTRQALSHLVDRKRIIHDILHDLARPVSGPFYINSPAYDESIEPYPYSIETAKKLLSEAGWKDTNGDGVLDLDGRPLQFTVIYPNTAESYAKMLPIIKEDMAKAGVKMEILALEWSVMLERVDKKQFDAVILAWRMSISDPDPYQLWHSDGLKQEASSNYISFNNAEADRLIMEIRQCFDPKKRNELYHQFHRLIHEETPYLFLFNGYDLFVLNSRYQNANVFAAGLFENAMWVKKAEQMTVPGL